MIRLIQRKLIIPRGDTGSFSIPTIAAASQADVAVFTIFDCLTRTKAFQKTAVPQDSILMIEFTHNDTVNLAPGRYVWDIKFYKNPVYSDGELVNGEEIDSYYAGYSLPGCEIRETGDDYLISPDAPSGTLTPEQLDIISAALSDLAAAVQQTETNVSHYPQIRDEEWYVWSAEANDYVATGVSANGIVGNGIASAVLNDDYSLTLNFTDGTSFTSPSIRGETGNGIDDIVLNNDFTLTIIYTDGERYTTPSIRGPVGPTPQFSIGTVQEGASAAATITGTAEAPVLNLTLPNANVPTKVSELDNDAGYLTEHQDLSDYIKNTDYATSTTAGIVKVAGLGVKMSDNEIVLAPASNGQMKRGSGDTAPIVAAQQHQSTFYGLAKAAGDTTQSQSSNAVGTYTDEAKTAIQTMLDVPSNADVAAKQDTLTFDSAPTANSTNPVTSGGVYNAIANVNTMKIHICAQGEYNTETGVPTVQNPDTQTFYLVPGGEGSNLFIEWVYVNGAWERFGSADVDLSGYATKADTVLDTTLSRGRKEGSTIGTGSVAFGFTTEASGNYSQAFGSNTSASGGGSYANGINAIASGNYSHAEGNQTTSSGNYSHAEGYKNIASGSAAHAEGYQTTSSATGSHSEGKNTIASGQYAHAEGNGTSANGMRSHAEGYNTITLASDSHASGKYNVADSYSSWPEWTAGTSYVIGDKVKVTTVENNQTIIVGYICKTDNSDAEFTATNWTEDFKMNYADIVGNGTADDARSNAYALDWDGNGHYAGDVYVHANADSSGGVKLATVEDIPAVPVTDVQVNGVSVVTDGVANVPIASNDGIGVGVVGAKASNGILINSRGLITLSPSNMTKCKGGTNSQFAIVPNVQHYSAFYGLAKAAGDTTQSASSNAVGQYTDNAKASIKAMLGVQDGSTGTVDITGTTPTIAAVENTRYVCGEVSTLSFTPASSGICIVRFTSGSTATVLTIPSTVKFPEWFDATALETDTTYEICVTDGIYGAVMSWAQ